VTGLDPGLWRERPGMRRLLAALEADAGRTRLVGGAVRDWLLGLPVSPTSISRPA
jgi:poly(A) polymerase